MAVIQKESCAVEVNGIRRLPDIPSITGTQKLYLIQYTVDGTTYYNHHLSGFVPMNLDTVKQWVKQIAALGEEFDTEACWG